MMKRVTIAMILATSMMFNVASVQAAELGGIETGYEWISETKMVVSHPVKEQRDYRYYEDIKEYIHVQKYVKKYHIEMQGSIPISGIERLSNGWYRVTYKGNICGNI